MDTNFGMGCTIAGPGRGDCEHFIGLPGRSIPGQHDGKDNTVDCYGKPNGWCWSCWKSYRLSKAQSELTSLLSQVERLTGERDDIRRRLIGSDAVIDGLTKERDDLVIRLAHHKLELGGQDGQIERLTQERDQALASCAVMREALVEISKLKSGSGECARAWCIASNTLSITCGNLK